MLQCIDPGAAFLLLFGIATIWLGAVYALEPCRKNEESDEGTNGRTAATAGDADIEDAEL